MVICCEITMAHVFYFGGHRLTMAGLAAQTADTLQSCVQCQLSKKQEIKITI